jgi:hypothetical protein
MKIERRIVDEKKKIVQITTSDERWYEVDGVYVPSVTWITHYYPKGKGFENWLAKNGMDDAEAIKQAAADKGSKVHHACTDLMKGKTVKFDSKYINNSSGQPEELTAEEYSAVVSFKSWADSVKAKFLKNDFVVVNKEVGYAGTVDFTCQIGEESYLVDIKSSQAVYTSHEIQIAAYKNADPELKDYKLAILQVGYKKNKAGFKFTDINDKFELFLSVRDIWKNETDGVSPLQRDYPLELTLNKEA